jgi:hypothetical protein
VFFVTVTVIYNLNFKDYQQFSFLTRSFLVGKLYFLEAYSSWWHDAVLFNGHYYWPLGPFPSVLLMPFAFLFGLFNQFFYQGYLQLFLIWIVYSLIYRIARKLDWKLNDSLYWAYAFCFSTAFLGVALWSNSWFFGQVVNTALFFAALHEYVNKKRYLIIGIFLGCIFLTRLTASLAAIFFVLDIMTSNKKIGVKIYDIMILGIPMGIAFLIWGVYNYARFGNPLEQGYFMQMTAAAFTGLKEYGLFNIAHIPSNIYYFLFASVEPVFNASHVLIAPFVKADPWGLSVFITSPFLILLFLVSYKDKVSISALIACILIALPIFTYYGIGWYQFGYRYSLDFLPLLLFLLIRNYRKKTISIPVIWKCIIIVSSLSNLYLFRTIFLM